MIYISTIIFQRIKMGQCLTKCFNSRARIFEASCEITRTFENVNNELLNKLAVGSEGKCISVKLNCMVTRNMSCNALNVLCEFYSK